MLRLSPERVAPPVHSFLRASEMLVADASLFARLCGANPGLEPGTTTRLLLAGLFAVLRRLGGDGIIVIGWIVGKDHDGSSRTSEPELLRLGLDVSDDPGFDALQLRIASLLDRARSSAGADFSAVGDLQSGTVGAEVPGTSCLFSCEHYLAEPAPEDPFSDIPWDLAENIALSDLYVKALVTRQGLGLAVEYDAQRYSAGRMQRLLGHLQTLLDAALVKPDTRLSALPILTDAQRRQILVDWNATAVPYPADATIHALFSRQARHAPDAVALQSEASSLTYGELDRRSDELAQTLIHRGIRGGSHIGMLVDRGFDLVLAMLGILKAGGAYVPLDPAYPLHRLQFMIRDADLTVILVQPRYASMLDWSGGTTPSMLQVDDSQAPEPRLIPIDRTWTPVEGQTSDKTLPLTNADAPAYVLYTSGTSGQPKGVVTPHRGVIRLVCGTRYARFDATRVFCLHSPATFDASTFEIWGALLHGARCIVLPADLPTPRVLGDHLQRHGVTTLFLTTALFNTVVDLAPDALSGVEEILVGGEALSVGHVRRARELLPDARLVNSYGPTETTTFAVCHDIPERVPGDLLSIPIGRPISNTTAYVLDARLQPVPIDVEGELFIGGEGLAIGYLGRPELTAQRFVSDPFAASPGARLYCTGDLARRLEDGSIEFLGRVDDQVKIRGFRIEPGEIEQVLRSHAEVRDVTIVVQTDQRGDKRLVAYVVTWHPNQRPVNEWRQYLATVLPEFMLPSAWVFLDALPMTPHGKVDRRHLPAPVDQPAGMDGLDNAPRSALEATLGEIWMAVLNKGPFGIHDDFFEAGGHSLATVQVASRIYEHFGIEISIRELFEHSTIATIAACIADHIAAQRLAAQRLAQPDQGAFG